MTISIQDLISIVDPITNKAFAERVSAKDGRISISCPYPVESPNSTHNKLIKKTLSIKGIDTSLVDLRFNIKKPIVTEVPNEPKHIPSIKHIIAIGSGKGGVGKSTISMGIAKSLQELGAKVGILDADIYGPNQDILIGNKANSRLKVNSEKDLIPFDIDGICLMTFAGMSNRDTPVVWRGPMISSALKQMLMKTKWPELDYLIVDLPPGTGDIQLTLFKDVYVDGFVLVTTPQTMAMEESKKTLAMIEKLNINYLGMVENMNRFICDGCNKEHYIFGKQYQLNDIGSIPIDRELYDANGKMIFDPAQESCKELISIADKVTGYIAKNTASKKGSVIAVG